MMGQFFMAPIPGTELDKGTVELIKNYGVSKFILFARNTTKGPENLKRLCLEIKDLCRRSGLFPIIAVDQEGGPVRRLRPPQFKDMESPTDVRKSKSPEKKVRELAMSTCALLKSVAIDMNLAPVLDLCLDGEKHVLNGRCFNKDPLLVARLAKLYIEVFIKEGILCCCKHFPGIGRVKLDPHHHLPRVDAPKETIMNELYPFKEAIKGNCPAIMTSHVIYDTIDAKRAATFSYKIATSILKESLSFKGILITDDLEMEGAQKTANRKHECLLAFEAGHDLLLYCKSQIKVRQAIDFLYHAAKKGDLSPNRIYESQTKIQQLEIRLAMK